MFLKKADKILTASNMDGKYGKTALATTDQDNRQTEEGSSDGPLMDTTNLAVKNLIKKGKERGFLTHDEVNSALPPIQFT